ncbi:hypothetical protein M0804_001368 [Polistes exclamans]|nr:hypothetical protein M0804_001368 [Polistes exclamans]
MLLHRWIENKSNIEETEIFNRATSFHCQGIRYALEVPARFQLSKLTSDPETPHILLRVSPFYEPQHRRRRQQQQQQQRRSNKIQDEPFSFLT